LSSIPELFQIGSDPQTRTFVDDWSKLLQAGYPSCDPANTVKALDRTGISEKTGLLLFYTITTVCREWIGCLALYVAFLTSLPGIVY